ncbi:hypothetical protein CPY53_04215 [Paenibacillus polymyxa]|uniref:hypothetical protein n=1 Tax=Paenibacillus polymyxa TaxID=1406 RepID=UPI001F59334F|nr:hypothetical protein [Paenibacillus polymyxa]UNL92810.1 hypothetical protein CPY53_04215 [Paenibacillus polymyxa]
MAKLNVTVPAVDVEVNGVKYRKVVDRDAQVGDIIRYMDDESSYVTTGAFYEVTRIDECGDPQIVDNDGDEHDLCGEGFEVYAKVSETAEYREVKRWAEPGERIRIVDKVSYEERYENGAEFVVDFARGNGDVHVEDFALVLLSEYVVLVPVSAEESAPKRLTVGDYARITGESRGHQFKIGEIVKIVKDDESEHLPYKGETADGRGRIASWFGPGEYEPATEAEFLAQKRLKVGEVAKVVAKNRMFTEARVSVGDLVKITEDDDSSRPFNTDTIDGKNAGWFTESELVRATDEEVAEANRKLTIEVGSTVRLTIKDGEKPAYGWGGVSNGAIGKVTRINGDSARVEFPEQSRWHALLSELTLAADGEKPQPQPEPVRFKVGEYARTLTDVRKDLPKGSIVKITRDDHDSRPFRAVLLDDSDFDFYRQNELERIDADTAKWAMIGREVNEFKAGDIVTVDKPYGAPLERGQLVTVRHDSDSAGSVSVTDIGWSVSVSSLVTPVEQRFDRMELTEVESKAAA